MQQLPCTHTFGRLLQPSDKMRRAAALLAQRLGSTAQQRVLVASDALAASVAAGTPSSSATLTASAVLKQQEMGSGVLGLRFKSDASSSSSSSSSSSWEGPEVYSYG